MGFLAKTTLQILCLSAVSAALEEETVMESFVRRIRESDEDEIDESEASDFEGDIVLDEESERDLDVIFATTVRGGRKNKDKKMQRQKVKKTKHILRLLKFAEPDRRAREWLGYGCYCFADVKSDILSPGVGKAIDPIDRACRSLSDCLKCSEFDFGISKKCHPHVGYKYESVTDSELGLKSINCIDSKSSCARSMCECDRRFLQSVQEHAYELNHTPNGGFQKESECPKRAQRADDGNVGDNNGGKTQLAGRMTMTDEEPQQKCCGPPGERHLITLTPTRGCCSQQTYNPFLFDCCGDGTIEAVGSC